MDEKSKREPPQPKDKTFIPPLDRLFWDLDPALSDREFFLDVLIKALALGEITASQFALIHLALVNPTMAQVVLENLHKVFPA